MSLEIRRTRSETWYGALSALLLRLALAVAVGYVLYRVGFIIVVVLMAVMLALAVAPMVDWLRRSRLLRPFPLTMRRGIATSIVFFLLALGLGALIYLIIHPLATEIREFARNWESYQKAWASRFQLLHEQYNALPADIRLWVERQGFGEVGTTIGAQLQHLAHRTLESGMLLVELILIPVLAFSFLTEGRPLKRELTALIPRARLRDWLSMLKQTATIFQSYAVGQLILALIAGGVVWVLMITLGVRYALAMAVIAAVTRVIPVIGPLVGGIPIVLISSLQGWERGLIVLVAFTVLHLVESKVVMPRIIGYRIKLHPAVVIIVLLIGAEFFGMWGMFLAAPVAAVVKALIHYFFVRPRTRKPGRRIAPKAPTSSEGMEVERPAVAGFRTHSRAH